MKIEFRGMIVEIVHGEEGDALTVQTGKRKSKVKVEAGQLTKSLLYTGVNVTIETDPGMFDRAIDPETGEIIKAEITKKTAKKFKAAAEAQPD